LQGKLSTIRSEFFGGKRLVQSDDFLQLMEGKDESESTLKKVKWYFLSGRYAA
jgi:hypothetical protein